MKLELKGSSGISYDLKMGQHSTDLNTAALLTCLTFDEFFTGASLTNVNSRFSVYLKSSKN